MSVPHYEPESEREMRLFDRFCKYHGLPRPHGLGGWNERFADPANTIVVKAAPVHREEGKANG